MMQFVINFLNDIKRDTLSIKLISVNSFLDNIYVRGNDNFRVIGKIIM